MKLDYSGGAFRENGLVFVATIDATGQTGGITQVRSDPTDIHAFSTYVCSAHKACVPHEVYADPAAVTTDISYQSCYIECNDATAGAYDAIV